MLIKNIEYKNARYFLHFFFVYSKITKGINHKNEIKK